MSLYLQPWNISEEPTQGNIRHWLDNLYTKFQPIEQMRWNQANIDTLFYAGDQSFVNRHFNFTPNSSYSQYYFNILQQPVNMITGYQRQHRKQITFVPINGADPLTTDQYTRLTSHVCQHNGINEAFSKSCELSCVAGLNLMQPYLDFTEEDPAQGQLKVKVWEYNSFLVDPYFRQPDMSDATFVWCQEYINYKVAANRFGEEKIRSISPLVGSPQRYSNFYFLPESYNMNRNDLMILSYVWYKWYKKKKKLYSKKVNQFFDFAGGDEQLDVILQHIPDLEVVTVDSPCWKVAVVLNDQMMQHGENPLWDGPECPFIPNYWNYEPHVNHYELRSRSLIYTMRAPQFLFNYKVIQNNDIAAATINAGWKRKIGAVANEDNLKKSGQGWDIIINEGYELGDVEKIIPSAVPESDLALAQQMSDLIYQVSGINLENWSGQEDKQISALTAMLKQSANLMVFQKYFDQWDHTLKILGERLLQIALYNWNEDKVRLLIGEDPSPHFFSRIFAKYKAIVEEGVMTPTQRNLQARNLMEINAAFGREVFPPSMIVKDMNMQGKAEAMEFLQQQEQQAAQIQQEQMQVAHAFEHAKLQELISKAAGNLAMARERHGRAEADIGLFEERLSEITQNRAMATKAKMEALEKLVDVISKFGEIETMLKMNQLESIDMEQIANEDREKVDARRTSFANDFIRQVMQGGENTPQNQQQPEMAQQT